MRRTLRVVAMLAAFVAVLATPVADTSADAVTDELARAVRAHPDDPDLLLALAAHLETTGDAAAASSRFEAYLRRWPERRPELWLRLGRLLQQQGRHEEAVTPLRRAVTAGHDAGAAHLHLGISLRQLGRHGEAEREFVAAGRLEPALLPETSLLQALSRIDVGDDDGAVPHLERAIELDPGGEASRGALLLLRAQRATERPPWARAELWGGYETDSNVTLDGATDLPSVSPERSDARAVWGAGVTLHPLHRRRVGLSLGVRYDQAEQEEISSFDTRRELAFASLRVSPHERFSLRLDGLATRTRLDHRRYQRTRSLRPTFFLGWGDRAGVTRLFAEYEQVSYPEEPFLPSLDRDGWAAGGGLDHFWPLPGLAGAWASLGGDWRRFDTDSERDDLLRLASPYDHDRYRATVRLRGPELLGFRGEASFSWAREDFEHRNVLDLLSTGNLAPRTRRDTVLEGRFTLVRPVTRYADVELRLQHTDRSSNLAIYDYDRRILGVYLRVHTP